MWGRRRAGGAAAVVALALAGCGSDGSAGSSEAVDSPAITVPSVPGISLDPESATAPTDPAGPGSMVASPETSVAIEPGQVPATVMVGDLGSPPIIVDDDYLAGVPAVSVPLAISVHLSQVQLAVRSIVGNDIFAGAAVTDDTSAEVRITIYGTDVAAIGAALDGVDTDQRDRIAIAASEYSFAELRDVAAQVESALHDAGLEPVWVSERYDGSGVDVELERTNDRPDDELIAAANGALAGLPVTVTVSDPLVPL